MSLILSDLEDISGVEPRVRCERRVGKNRRKYGKSYKQCPEFATQAIEWEYESGHCQWERLCDGHSAGSLKENAA